jgi:exopolysaccharide biosynthesis polyprenyl glycosylphosphotransferase
MGQGLAPALCFFLAVYYNDLYDLRSVKTFRDFSANFPRALCVFFVLVTILYSFFPRLGLYRRVLFSSVWSLVVICGVVILPLRWLLYSLIKIRPLKERVLILGTGPLAGKITEEIEAASHLGYLLVGFVDDRVHVSTEPLLYHRYPILGPLHRFEKILEEQRPDRIVVALGERRGRMPLKDLLSARVSGLVVEDGIKALERFSGKLAIESLTPSFLIFSSDFSKLTIEMALRRMISLSAATVGLVLTAPLMLCIAIAIQLDSSGPVFFTQDRAGLKGRVFRLLKFRTMHPAPADEAASLVWNRDESLRVTRVGKWLRKTHLDELPQFINILRGDMDLVGPRPEMACNIKAMTEQIPYYALRMTVRPGVTGWAQVRSGYAVSQEDVTEKMRHDLYYIKHMSLWLDLRILIDTVKIVLLGKGSQTGSTTMQFLPEIKNEEQNPELTILRQDGLLLVEKNLDVKSS